MYRGTHERDYVEVDTTRDFDGVDQYYILHEEKHPIKGTFFIIQLRYFKGHYVVCWRPKRNNLRMWDIYPMTTPNENRRYFDTPVIYPTKEDAMASFSTWAETYEIPKQYLQKKTYRTRDSQKSKVYKWEHRMAREIGPKTEMDRDKLHANCSESFLRNMLEHVCHNLNEKAPMLKFRTGGACSYGGIDIRLAPSHKNRLILLHELAHVLHRRWGHCDNKGKMHAGHGKEFVGIYCYLLIRFGEVDQDKLIQHLVSHKIKYQMPRQFADWMNSNQQLRMAA